MNEKPKYLLENFSCPHCGVYAQHNWFQQYMYSEIVHNIIQNTYYGHRPNIADFAQKYLENFIILSGQSLRKNLPAYVHSDLAVSTCMNCKNPSIWIKQNMVYPDLCIVDSPNKDLNQEIQDLYNEASKIFLKSPKGSTAILRLALQKFMIQVGMPRENINNDIRQLVANGLNVKIQQALDSLRVVGNNAVHPGQIDLDDNADIAFKLFKLLNFICDELITKPKDLSAFYNEVVPESTRDHISRVDSKK